MGNLIYRKTARNFGPIMAAAAETTIVQTDQLVEIGDLDPEAIVTPSIYVNRLVEVPPLFGPQQLAQKES
jgi:3-oxoadipate CoA-transferase alpha subunit